MQCLRFDTAWKHTICLWLRFTSGWRMRLGWCPSWKCLGPAGALNWSPFIHKHEVITTHKCKMAKVSVSTPWCAFKVKTLQRKSYRSYLSLSLLQIKGSQSGEPSSPSEFTFLEDLCWQEEEMHWPVWPKVRVGMGSLSWGSRDTHTVSGAEESTCCWPVVDLQGWAQEPTGQLKPVERSCWHQASRLFASVATGNSGFYFNRQVEKL